MQWIICIGIPLVLYLIPSNEVYTTPIKLFLALSLFAILLVAFDFLNVMAVGFLLPAIYWATGIAPAEVAWSAWTQDTVFVIMGAFLLAQFLEETGLLKRIAYWCIIKCGGSYRRTVWGIFATGLLLSAITFGNAYVLMAALAYGICKAMDLGKSKESAVLTMAAITGGVSSRMFLYTPFSIGLMENGGRTIDPNFSINLLMFTVHNIPMLFYSILFILMLFIIFRPKTDSSSREYFTNAYSKLGALSTAEKKAGGILILLIVYVLSSPLHGFNLNYGFILIPWLAFAPGISIANENTVRNLNFSMIFFIVGCLALGIVSGYLGLGAVVAQIATPIMMNLPLAGVIAAIVLLGGLLNFVLTPIAILAALSGPIAAIATSMGIDITAPLYALLYSTEVIVFPYEYVPQLIFFSFGMITMGDFAKMSLLKGGLCILFAAVIMVPYWMLFGML